MTNEELLAKIKAEIERLKENILSKVHHYPIHRIELLDDLLAFLDTLESEKPVPADLAEAAWGYASKECEKDAFIAGAKWQKHLMLQEAVEGKVFMSFAPGHNQMVMADVDLPTNTKVRIIIVKED